MRTLCHITLMPPCCLSKQQHELASPSRMHPTILKTHGAPSLHFGVNVAFVVVSQQDGDYKWYYPYYHHHQHYYCCYHYHYYYDY